MDAKITLLKIKTRGPVRELSTPTRIRKPSRNACKQLSVALNLFQLIKSVERMRVHESSLRNHKNTSFSLPFLSHIFSILFAQVIFIIKASTEVSRLFQRSAFEVRACSARDIQSAHTRAALSGRVSLASFFSFAEFDLLIAALKSCEHTFHRLSEARKKRKKFELLFRSLESLGNTE